MSCYTNSSYSFETIETASHIFTSALQVFAASQCLIAPNPLPEALVWNCKEFDFIIVGAGTAGCVVANRLTENQNVSVLLIEAGDDAPVESRVPGLGGSLYGSKYDWQYLTTNDGRTNKANKDGCINWTRGKMIGGSSSINGMFYIKGRQYEYDEWYKSGNEDWHPDIVQAYCNDAPT